MGRNTEIIPGEQELLGCIPTNTPFDECDRVHYKPDFDGNGTSEAYLWDGPTINAQVENMEFGHISVAIVSWWGLNSTSDGRLQDLFTWTQSQHPGFKFGIYYEYAGVHKAAGDDHEYPDSPIPRLAPPDTSTELALELLQILDVFWGSQDMQARYLSLDNRPVFFVYNIGYKDCDTVDFWRDALDQVEAETGVRPFVVLSAWNGAAGCSPPNDPNFAFHHYGTGGVYRDFWADDQVQTATIRPGFWRCRLAQPGQVRDANAWTNAIDSLNNTDVRWFQLIVSYNEWIEMTAIEPSTDWRTNTRGGIPQPPPIDLGIYLNELAQRPPQ
ncbi:MAG: hypothetical protein DRJ61_08360 [Acidobacteria bacterium]|nr:MAG: hypothetical protein DRJ65_19140 [Acidobacteriota bacterium]RLE32933.1 MAG: hypothetical protein DRJ61_08360 [Acidobacteriota bacterium]